MLNCYTLFTLLLLIGISTHVHNTTERQELTSVGLTYIYTCRSNIHTPHDFTKGASVMWSGAKGPKGNVVEVAHALANSFDFGLSWGKVPQNASFPTLDADEPPCKIRRH